MDKGFLVEQLGAKLREAVQRTHRDATDARTDARSGANRAVNLARGQLLRSTQAREALDAMDGFRVRPLRRSEPIGLGALVEIDGDEGGRSVFLAPVGAGEELTGPGGDGFFHVVTPASPLGRALMGKKVGDTVDVSANGEPVEWTVVDVC